MNPKEMQTAMKTTDPSYVKAVGECSFILWQQRNKPAIALIEQRTSERVHRLVPDMLVQNTALARYFRLLDIARDELRNMFNEHELFLMLDREYRPILTGEFTCTPADIFYSHYWDEDEELVEEDSDAYRLHCKLSKLTPLQQVALIDVLECAFRDPTEGPLKYAMGALHSGEDSRSRS